MTKFKVKISLRYKLLALLTVLPIICLALYLLMATDLFKRDKVAYVFDSSATVSRSLAMQLRTELHSVSASLRNLVEQYDLTAAQFSPVAQRLFKSNQPLLAVIVYQLQPQGGYKVLGQLSKSSELAQSFTADTASLNKLRAKAVQKSTFMTIYPESPGVIGLAYLAGEKSSPDHSVVLALYHSPDLVKAYQPTETYTSLLVSRSGRIIIGETPNLSPGVIYNILSRDLDEGVAETKLGDGQTALISYSSVGVGDLVTVSVVNKTVALQAVEVLVAKSILFFVALIATTLLISVFASNQLTASLRELFEATRKVAQGDFAVRVEHRSSDEVGGLAESFNIMTAEVSRLMNETAEKARMEGELATVRAVQETLFPEPQIQFGPLKIMGHFEPASECGGDWWNYSRVGDKIYICIGDATGHGASAALMTSAARSAVAVIESLGEMKAGRAMSILNHAIHQTSKGQMMMTFFLGIIDLTKGELSYSCASHDPPYLIQDNSGKRTKKDLIPLNDVNGPRLGERKEFAYTEATTPFAAGDQLFFYTDGIIDVQDRAGGKWGERAFLKAIVESSNIADDVNAKMASLRLEVDGFRDGSALIDDVTLVVCEFEKKAATVEGAA